LLFYDYLLFYHRLVSFAVKSFIGERERERERERENRVVIGYKIPTE